MSKYAYLAGLMDADGTFTIHIRKYKNYTSYVPLMFLYNTDGKLLDWVQNNFPTTYRRITVNDNGWKDQQNLQFSSGNQMEIIPKLLPYLTIKKDRAKMVLELCKINNDLLGVTRRYNAGKEKHEKYNARKNELFMLVREANKRGK